MCRAIWDSRLTRSGNRKWLEELPLFWPRSFLTEYSCPIRPACYPELMRKWFDAIGRLELERGASFDVDFHTIPYHGDDALVEKHYVSKRSRKPEGGPHLRGPGRGGESLLLYQRPAAQ